MQITNADFRALLPAGVSFSAVQYPDTESALAACADILDALLAAQSAQNALAPAGQDVSSLVAVNGGQQQIEFPPGSGTNITVIPRVYTLTIFMENTVTNTYPVLA